MDNKFKCLVQSELECVFVRAQYASKCVCPHVCFCMPACVCVLPLCFRLMFWDKIYLTHPRLAKPQNILAEDR